MKAKNPKPGPSVPARSIIAADHQRWRPHAPSILLLWTFLLLAYSNSFRTGLIFDNRLAILQDTRVQAATAENVSAIMGGDYWYRTSSSGLLSTPHQALIPGRLRRPGRGSEPGRLPLGEFRATRGKCHAGLFAGTGALQRPAEADGDDACVCPGLEFAPGAHRIGDQRYRTRGPIGGSGHPGRSAVPHPGEGRIRMAQSGMAGFPGTAGGHR